MGTQKYVICNADEGDPGAFMDRSVLESDPHRVLEGMLIAAYAVGASEGYIYVRAEYPLAIKRLRTAIRQAERLGLLGANICGTRFSFRIDLRLGAGAFVCGEETALIASVEGKRGTPRPRPPYPAQEGLFGQPTLINNVETYANVAPIIRNGGDWYAQHRHGKEQRHQSLRARRDECRTPGWSKCRWASRLREIVFEIGGGIPEGTQVQSGADRRSFRRLPARGMSRYAGRLRIAGQGRIDHGFGRHDRDGRKFLHGRCREILHGLLHDRILRQVRSVPRREPTRCTAF